MSTSKRARASVAANKTRRAQKVPLKRGTGTGEGLKVIYCTGCWCGEPYGHDWEGKAEGAPHPR